MGSSGQARAALPSPSSSTSQKDLPSLDGTEKSVRPVAVSMPTSVRAVVPSQIGGAVTAGPLPPPGEAPRARAARRRAAGVFMVSSLRGSAERHRTVRTQFCDPSDFTWAMRSSASRSAARWVGIDCGREISNTRSMLA